ncbi:MAG TPA: copper resistance CopC family protein, partial [Candidatus Limnocylindrales bacterium]
MPTRHVRRPVTALAALLLLMALGSTIVLGHAELATASPADKATVTGSPPEIVFTFTEPVVPAKSSLKLVDNRGKIVAEGSTVDPTDAKTMRLTLGAQPPGTYTVRWTTASALDGDLDHGITTFTIAAASPSPPIAASATPSESVAASEAPSPSAVATSPSPSG